MGASDNYTQTGFRLRFDDGNETTATWQAATNVNKTQALGVNFRLRFLIRRDALASNDTNFWQVFESYNGGTFTHIQVAVTKSEPFVSSNYVHEDETTQQIGSGVYNTSGANDSMCNSVDFLSMGITWVGDGGNQVENEIEISLVIQPGSVSNGDTLEYRVRRASNALDGGYIEVPILTVVKGGLRISGGTITIH